MQKEKYKGEDRVMRAARLREARRRHFDSMKAAAKFHGWREATLTAHERGGRAFKYERAEEYAKAFEVDIGWLWKGRPAETSRPEVSPQPDVDATRSCEEIITLAKGLVEHIKLAIEAATRLYVLAAMRESLSERQ